MCYLCLFSFLFFCSIKGIFITYDGYCIVSTAGLCCLNFSVHVGSVPYYHLTPLNEALQHKIDFVLEIFNLVFNFFKFKSYNGYNVN